MNELPAVDERGRGDESREWLNRRGGGCRGQARPPFRFVVTGNAVRIRPVADGLVDIVNLSGTLELPMSSTHLMRLILLNPRNSDMTFHMPIVISPEPFARRDGFDWNVPSARSVVDPWTLGWHASARRLSARW